MAETERHGTIASDGLFIGPLSRLESAPLSARRAGTPDEEKTAMAAAIAAASRDIAALMDKMEGEAADILEFQLALLEDNELVAPVEAAIAGGLAADTAWQQAIDTEIAGYEAAEDEYFRARAADLRDMRDRVTRHLSGNAGAGRAAGVVFVGEDIAPTRFLETDWSKGGAIVLTKGSTTAHVAMLARARGVPMLVGLGDIPDGAGEVIVDALEGVAVFDPDPETKSGFAARSGALAEKRQAEEKVLFAPVRLRDGTPVEVFVNIASLDELDAIDPAICDGIGLMRSEFLFPDGKDLPTEEDQYQAYKRLLDWAGDKPVIIRTLDAGGDKPIGGLTPAGEQNPFLGLRGVRLMLTRPDVFRVQLRALARAAVHGRLKIMIPMVTVPDEITRTTALFDDCVRELEEEGVQCARPPLGIMVEVPAVAICPEQFGAAAFFSIGSNDLTQYVTAAARGEAAVTALNTPANPAVRRLIETTVRFARNANIEVSLCGDMASDPAYLEMLVDAGLRRFSVAPARVGRVKLKLREL